MEMNHYLNKICLACLLLSLTGCTTLTAILPTATVESPFINKSTERPNEFVLRTEPGVEFKLVQNASERPLQIQNPPSVVARGFRLSDPKTSDLSLGLPLFGVHFRAASRFQYGVMTLPTAIWFSQFGFVVRGMVKYLIFESADEIHSLSAFGHLTWSYSQLSGNQKVLFGPGGYPWRAHADVVAPNLGISYGYRSSPKLTSYLGFAYQDFKVSGQVNQDVSTTGDSPSAETKLSPTSGFSKALQVGLTMGEAQSFDLSYSYTEVRWQDFQNQIHFLSFGFRL